MAIHPCVCKNEYQDQKYGKGNRVFNRMSDSNRFRCTVCRREIEISGKTQDKANK